MAVKIVCRKGLYVYKTSDPGVEGIYFRRIYSFEPPLYIYTTHGALNPPVPALQFATNTTPYNAVKAGVSPRSSSYTRQVYLRETSANLINMQNIPYNVAGSSGVSVQWYAALTSQLVQPNYILNPTLANPTSYDSCMISWAYKNTNFTFLNKK